MAAGKRERNKERGREGGRMAIIAISLLSSNSFLEEDTVSASCAVLLHSEHSLQRSQPRCTPSTPLNCQHW